MIIPDEILQKYINGEPIPYDKKGKQMNEHTLKALEPTPLEAAIRDAKLDEHGNPIVTVTVQDDASVDGEPVNPTVH